MGDATAITLSTLIVKNIMLTILAQTTEWPCILIAKETGMKFIPVKLIKKKTKCPLWWPISKNELIANKILVLDLNVVYLPLNLFIQKLKNYPTLIKTTQNVWFCAYKYDY